MALQDRIPDQKLGRKGLLSVLAVVVALVVMAMFTVGLTACSSSPTATTGSSAGSTVSTSSSSPADTSSASSNSGTTNGASPAKSVAKKLGPSVVNISVKASGQGQFGQSQQTSWSGSGVIYTSDGKIITNNHVVYQDGYTVSSIAVTLATGEQLPATLLGRDAMTEIAVIKVTPKSSLPAAKFNNNLPSVGDYAIAIGSPYGFENSVTMGIISGVNRKIDDTTGSEAAALSSLLQTDAPINSGNSGGALANENSEVVGINVAKLSTQSGAENLGFAIPSVVATKAADEIIKTGKVTHAYLGIATQTVDSSMQKDFGLSSSGVLVAQVTANGPAAKAGIKQGDYILKIDNTPVSDSSDLLIAVRDKKPGDVVKVTIKRGNQESTVNVTLQERPANLQ